ncbi:MAG TPA: carbon-nitrogen hydrolase family protein [Acidimicrobiales bacterium]
MAVLRLALLQVLPPGPDPAANLEAGLAACREAAAAGAHLALFPEVWSNGYTPCPDDEDGRRRWRAAAVRPGDGFVEAHGDLARTTGMAIAVTHLAATDGDPRNTVTVIDRSGEVALTYAKVHLCRFPGGTDLGMAPGDGFDVADVDTAAGPVRVGAMICFDREFPESARLLMLGGAELVLCPNSCDLEANRLAQLRARAFENMVVVATANYPAPKDNGHSCVFGPVAFDRHEASLDTLLFEAGEAPGVFVVDVDLDAVRSWRAREVWGSGNRRPDVYAALAGGSTPPVAAQVPPGGAGGGP